MSMDQTGQKQKAKRENRVKPRPNDGERPGNIPLHRELFGVSDPGTSARPRRGYADDPRHPEERRSSEHHSVPSYHEHIKVNIVHINRGQAGGKHGPCRPAVSPPWPRTAPTPGPTTAMNASPRASTLLSAACRQPSAHPNPATHPDQIKVLQSARPPEPPEPGWASATGPAHR